MRKVFTISFHVVIWLLVYLLPYTLTYGFADLPNLVEEPGDIVHAASTLLLIGYAYLNHFLLVPKFYLSRKYMIFGLVVLAGLIVVIWTPQAFGFGPDGPRMPPGVGPQMGRGHLPIHPPRLGVSKISYNVILFVICTFVSISARQQRQLLEMQKEKLNTELAFLKAQINPHFLFNTLNSIYALAIQNSVDTPQAIIQLSELMRYILKDAAADTVPLSGELAYIENYVALQKRRLGNTVQIEYSSTAGMNHYRIAPLILTSFVENAFKHGVNPDEDSAIRLSINLEEKSLQLLVVNNKVRSVHQDETMGIGLKNARARLEHLYPGKHH